MKIFIGGSRINGFGNNLPAAVCKRLDYLIDKQHTFLIGDAPGVDKLVQDYLYNNRYQEVVIYYSGKYPRNKTDTKWNGEHISNNLDRKLNAREVQQLKDVAMAEEADGGYMIWSDIYINPHFGNKCVSNGTMNNICNLLMMKKPTVVYFVPNSTEYVLKNLHDFETKLLPVLDQMTQKKWLELNSKFKKGIQPHLI